LLVALYLLLPPLAAWQSGALSLYTVGLSELDWLANLSVGGPLALAISGIVLLGWLIYRRRLTGAEGFSARPKGFSLASPGQPVPWPRPARTGLADGPGGGAETLWVSPLNAGLWQWHWAFYRAAAIGWLAAGAPGFATIASVSTEMLTRLNLHVPSSLTMLAQEASTQVPPLLATLLAQPLYWGSWLGLGLLALEWFLNPFARADLRMAGRLEGSARLIAMAIATTALFATTRNFWLCLACHVLVETVIAGFFPVSPSRASG
jgi:hypothetical protein